MLHLQNTSLQLTAALSILQEVSTLMLSGKAHYGRELTTKQCWVFKCCHSQYQLGNPSLVVQYDELKKGKKIVTFFPLQIKHVRANPMTNQFFNSPVEAYHCHISFLSNFLPHNPHSLQWKAHNFTSPNKIIHMDPLYNTQLLFKIRKKKPINFFLKKQGNNS